VRVITKDGVLEIEESDLAKAYRAEV
jgi:hypothetical protein